MKKLSPRRTDDMLPAEQLPVKPKGVEAKKLTPDDIIEELHSGDFDSMSEFIGHLTDQLEKALESMQKEHFFSRAEMTAIAAETIAMHRILIGIFSEAGINLETTTFDDKGYRQVLRYIFGTDQRCTMEQYRAAATQMVVFYKKAESNIKDLEAQLEVEKLRVSELQEKNKKLEDEIKNKGKVVEPAPTSKAQDTSITLDEPDEPEVEEQDDSSWYIRNTKQKGKYLGVLSASKNKGMKTKVENVAKVDVDEAEGDCFLEFSSKEEAQAFLAYLNVNASKLNAELGVNKTRLKNYEVHS